MKKNIDILDRVNSEVFGEYKVDNLVSEIIENSKKEVSKTVEGKILEEEQAKVPPHILKFFKYYFKYSNGQRAWLRVCKERGVYCSKATAGVTASGVIHRYPELRRAFIERAGLGLHDQARILKEAGEAERTIYNRDGVMVAIEKDHRTRLEAVKLADKLSGNDKENGSTHLTQNVVIIKDRQKGIYKVGVETVGEDIGEDNGEVIQIEE